MLLFDPIPAAAKLQFGSPSAQVGDALLHGFGFHAFFQLGHSHSRSRAEPASHAGTHRAVTFAILSVEQG